MKRNITGYILLLLFLLGMGWTYNEVVITKPAKIERLETELRFQQEKLISAQILASELDKVASLIEQNLAASARDSLAADASLPFLNTLIQTLNELNCELVTLKAHPRDRTVSGYIRTPYTVAFRGSYKQFGEFINLMEKSPRLVTLDFFKIDNNLTQLNFARTFEDLKVHDFVVKLSTMTLVRSDSRAEAGAGGQS
jgi:Tfp pilus assembly protein PilO